MKKRTQHEAMKTQRDEEKKDIFLRCLKIVEQKPVEFADAMESALRFYFWVEEKKTKEDREKRLRMLQTAARYCMKADATVITKAAAIENFIEDRVTY